MGAFTGEELWISIAFGISNLFHILYSSVGFHFVSVFRKERKGGVSVGLPGSEFS